MVWILHLYYTVRIRQWRNQQSIPKHPSILALPYYPENYAGGHARIGDWKPFFTKDQIPYTLHWASESQDFIINLMNGSPWKKYKFYTQILTSRLALLSQVRNYQSVWIQRAFIPFFPFRDAWFEKLLYQLHPHVIVDFYDADYESNHQLVLETARKAKDVTVASPYLQDYFHKQKIQSKYIRFAMDFTAYSMHEDRNDQRIIIGWMGAPVVAENLQLIQSSLQSIENQYPQVYFHFICREKPSVNLQRVNHSKWGDVGFHYHQFIAGFDIGICPMIRATEGDKARTSFKSLEFMSAAVPMVVSPWGISDCLIHEENCLFAVTESDWFSQIERLILSSELRKKLGQNARKAIEDNHAYHRIYPALKEVLVPSQPSN